MAKKTAPNFRPKAPKDVIIVDEEVVITTGETIDETIDTVDDTVEVEDTDDEVTVLEGSNPMENIEEESEEEEDEVILVTPVEEESAPKKVESSEVKFITNTPVKSTPDQKVKIKVGKNYSCTVGGERYFFEKDKTYNVPKNVKTVLSKEENLLKPL